MFGTILYIEADDDGGWHCLVSDLASGVILYITDSCKRAAEAERAAHDWLAKQAARQVAQAS